MSATWQTFINPGVDDEGESYEGSWEESWRISLRQYNRPAVVQAAMIQQVLRDAVMITDEDGRTHRVTEPDLFSEKPPTPGDWLLIWSTGKTGWIPAEEFNREWAPVQGPVLL